MTEREAFCLALREGSLPDLRRIPKSDLHSHAGRGGTLAYIGQWANVKIDPPSAPFDSLDEMNRWLNDHVKCHCPPGLPGYLKRVEAAFAQARDDGIAVLALSFAVDEVAAFGSAAAFVRAMRGLHQAFAPDTRLLPDLALGYDPREPDMLDESIDAAWFHGIDIINYAGAFSLDALALICRKAHGAGMICKAHAGEFDGADDVLRYAEALALDQVQHGIAAASSPRVMRWLADHRVQLNVCPTSNIMLRRCGGYSAHPIRKLYDAGVPVTINTDDLLIFDASVSQEYLNLYGAGLMTAGELNDIRETGLASA